MKLISLVLILLGGCGRGHHGKPTAISHEKLTPISTQTLNTKTNLSLFSAARERRLNEAIRRLLLVVNSENFKSRILNHRYKGVTQFANNNGESNQSIYDRIVDGSETLSAGVDNEMDLTLEIYYSSKNTIGYTYPTVQKIWINSRYFDKNSYAAIAANIMHEWLHKIGFTHAFSRTPERPYSVPYAVGSIVEELIEAFAGV